jgi:hypothetical protein
MYSMQILRRNPRLNLVFPITLKWFNYLTFKAAGKSTYFSTRQNEHEMNFLSIHPLAEPWSPWFWHWAILPMHWLTCSQNSSFLCSFSRQGIADASSALLFWLNENVEYFVLLCLNMAAAISLNAKTAHPDFSVADLHRPAWLHRVH